MGKYFNFSFGKNNPSQRDLGKTNSLNGYRFGGFGYEIDEFNLYSQVKDYRTDLLNGTNWRPTNQQNGLGFDYIQFLKVVEKYSTAIYNDYNRYGFSVFAKIDGKIFYISQNNYTKNEQKITVKGYRDAQVFVFDEPNAFCGEKTIYEKCEPYQRLYNIALSCQKNGLSKSGFVTVMTPKSASGANTQSILTEEQRKEIEGTLSKNHGVANDTQDNIMVFPYEVDLKTIVFDFAKMGITQTKQLCEEFVCSKLGVPYVLLPSSGQTFTNYEQANKILYENHSKYCEGFCKSAKSELGFDIDYKTIAEEGKGII